MPLNRRTLLKNLGAAGTVAALAGCVGVQESSTNQSGGDSDGSGDENTDSSTGETSESEPVGTASVWYSLPEPEIPGRKSALEQFNEASDHTVKGSDISDMRKKTTSAIPAGQGPQSFEWAHDWAGDYYQRGFVVDQSDQVDVDLDVFTGAAREAIQFDGNLVGLPHDAETVALVYNKDIVDEPPETVADMVSVMEEFHDPETNNYGLGLPFADGYFLSAWAHAFGGYYFDDSADERIGVALPETIKGVQFTVDNFVPYMPNDPAYEPQAAAFAEGNAAFAINGPWYLSTLNEKGIDYGVAKLPSPEGGEPKPFTGITMWYFAKAMEEGGADAAASRSFIEWFATSEDLALKAAQEQGSIPVLKSLVESGDLPEHVQGFSEAVQQGQPMPTHPDMGKVWDPVKAALTKAFNGKDVEKAMKTADEEIRSNLE
ncbi:extracellular solute-binding protein [Haloferax mediterranei ATCC 33500]|uniref:Extracellular solute-binding protein n=1 Tax=Haloferax mediterranei (strain ATCC 33500 / DSM 1411 / JCM 8866 / NBRC 14739 / NCIMB 2177 / R-4) TaxID=523841 RepID=I3R205_HALMT|nr:substrate-binding domain-containing protein [Haloferax mediterranei]AFK18265.1 maltose ABC transporter maltose-binding protein [Haloferax mediterranei ATCC 33500]AHZ22333.1 sugar ABC transporter substrate-binding protein [Haloferax mediterranei ATCC 33500]EMA02462.1 maltose ABC transporter maltose-binding protein [Haloferax mediterranei ATCC 33500]MDX5988355.1 substrate-binding domain-containing protein [Haloferax mediterranei ATCC 33500]QCQ74788.1 extracellular solute-binding protein [Halo